MGKQSSKKGGKAKDDGEENQTKVLHYKALFSYARMNFGLQIGKERPKGSHRCQCTTYTVREALQSNRGSAENTSSVP
jgi:hypothetical protein